MAKKAKSVAERIAERLFIICGDTKTTRSTHLVPTLYRPFLMRGQGWTKAGIVAVIEAELKRAKRRAEAELKKAMTRKAKSKQIQAWAAADLVQPRTG